MSHLSSPGGFTMLRRLILMRHAKSGWPEGVADHERPLAPRGQSTAPIMGRWLQVAGFRPDLALVSSARRTRETWAYIAPFLAETSSLIEERLFAASTASMMALVQACPAEISTLMIVAHNPGTQDLAHGLASRMSSDRDAFSRLGRKFPTAGIAVLEAEGEWRAITLGSMMLSQFMTPRFLGGIDED